MIVSSTAKMDKAALTMYLFVIFSLNRLDIIIIATTEQVFSSRVYEINGIEAISIVVTSVLTFPKKVFNITNA